MPGPPESTDREVVISPVSRVLAGPMGPEEGILYADIDLELAVRAKLTHDFAGHYNRPDVFQLHLNATAPQIWQRNPTLPGQETQNMAREVNAQGDGIHSLFPSTGNEQ